MALLRGYENMKQVEAAFQVASTWQESEEKCVLAEQKSTRENRSIGNESVFFKSALKNRVNPRFCVKSISGANRAKLICGGSRLVRLPPW